MLRSSTSVSVAISLLLSISGVFGTKSTVTCTRNYSWLKNKEGKDPCATWAEMRNLCDSSSASDITPLSSAYPSYSSPSSQTAGCDCNEEAYNLMASCVYCQGSAYDGKWTSVANWKTSCTSFESSFMFSSVFDDHLNEGYEISGNLPSSVNYYQPNTTWDPKKACYTGDDFDACENTVGSFSGGSSSSAGKPKATSTSKHSGGNSYDYYGLSDESVKWAWIGLAIACAIPALMSVIALIVCCVRQKNRKKFYAPLAAYYANGGAPPATAYNQNALMTGHYLSQQSSSTIAPPYYAQDSAFTVPLYKS